MDGRLFSGRVFKTVSVVASRTTRVNKKRPLACYILSHIGCTTVYIYSFQFSVRARATRNRRVAAPWRPRDDALLAGTGHAPRLVLFPERT